MAQVIKTSLLCLLTANKEKNILEKVQDSLQDRFLSGQILPCN